MIKSTITTRMNSEPERKVVIEHDPYEDPVRVYANKIKKEHPYAMITNMMAINGTYEIRLTEGLLVVS